MGGCYGWLLWVDADRCLRSDVMPNSPLQAPTTTRSRRSSTRLMTASRRTSGSRRALSGTPGCTTRVRSGHGASVHPGVVYGVCVWGGGCASTGLAPRTPSRYRHRSKFSPCRLIFSICCACSCSLNWTTRGRVRGPRARNWDHAQGWYWYF